MKLVVHFSESHRVLFECFLKPSVDHFREFTLISGTYPQIGNGHFGNPRWKESVRHKLLFMREVIQESLGEIVVFSDVDILFCQKVTDDLRERLGNKDALFHRDESGLCSGFYAMKSNRRSLDFLAACIADYDKLEPDRKFGDQGIMRLKRDMIEYGFLPETYYNVALFRERAKLDIPPDFPAPPISGVRPVRFIRDMRLFHASYLGGPDAKAAVLQYVKRLLNLPF